MSNIERVSEKIKTLYPSISKEDAEEIAKAATDETLKYSIDKGILPDGFVMGSYMARRLDLNSNYFNVAHKEDHAIKAYIIKIDGFIYVKPDDEIVKALSDSYICNKIKKQDIKEYDFTIQFSKNCLLGFYK